MSALQAIFQGNAEILSFRDAFDMAHGPFAYWMYPKDTGVYMKTTDVAIRFPLSEQGLSQDPVDILGVLADSPVLDIVQNELERVQKEMYDSCSHAEIKRLGEFGSLTFPFTIAVNLGGGHVWAAKPFIDAAKIYDPNLVRGIVKNIVSMESAPKGPPPVATKFLPPEIEEIINGVSFDHKL